MPLVETLQASLCRLAQWPNSAALTSALVTVIGLVARAEQCLGFLLVASFEAFLLAGGVVLDEGDSGRVPEQPVFVAHVVSQTESSALLAKSTQKQPRIKNGFSC